MTPDEMWQWIQKNKSKMDLVTLEAAYDRWCLAAGYMRIRGEDILFIQTQDIEGSVGI